MAIILFVLISHDSVVLRFGATSPSGKREIYSTTFVLYIVLSTVELLVFLKIMSDQGTRCPLLFILVEFN